MREDLESILEAGLAAADPKDAVRRHLRLEDGEIFIRGERLRPGRIFVVAAGKAAGPMARAAAEILGEEISGGIVVTKDGHEPGPEGLETLYASHPEPDERGLEAARRTAELAASLGEDDLLLLALVSGGASALLADPAEGIELGELKQLTSALLRSGASIDEINAVRKHVSTLKGGGLARLAHPARTVALLLSDVVGDDPSSIASGPTAPDPTTLQDARDVLRRYGIDPPASIARRLREGPETPKPGDPVFEHVVNLVVGGGLATARAAAEEARTLGYTPLLLSTYVTGESRAAAFLHAAIVRESLTSGNPAPPPLALVSGGETTVTVSGEGTGGPNQEFTLALALALEGVDGWAAFSVDTDGADGPTDAAGGLVDGETAARIRAAGLDPEEALARNDAHPALEAADALLITGPTGTNVNDLRAVLVRGGPRR
ncbi:D-glycerate 2-kinase [Rubrobacter xylanophilus DSM 9941]|uniref:glycerate kinase type-2 family protein n=1 Tax=Rubrobacter xylanophilus TaxID=49319 RepID=UPI001C6436B3|nr:glycerate kinase [Rubrobacter xylanophilus]QYJ15888.1 D-glycerate 2-kinase [Rubrobacter xylanophilus DSM 9941]